MTPAVKRTAQLFVSVAVAAACLWFAFHGVESGARGDEAVSLDDIRSAIAHVGAATYVGFGALMIVQFVVRTERWRLQVRGLTGVAPSWRDALAINAFAFAAVFLLPFRLGEFVRPNLCAQRDIMSASAGLAASALERVIDGLVTTALFGALLFLAPHDLPPPVRAGGFGALVLFGGAVVFFAVAFRFRAAALALVRRVAGVVHAGLAEKLVALVGGFLDGLACFKGVADVGVYVGLSAVYWGVNGASVWMLLRAIDPAAPLDAGFFCLCFLVMGVMIPAPAGNVGTFEAFGKAGLRLAGVAAVPAMACVVLLHALQAAALVAWAALFLVVGGFKMGELTAKSTPPPA